MSSCMRGVGENDIAGFSKQDVGKQEIETG